MTADELLEGDLAEPVRGDVARILRGAVETENMSVDLLGMVRIVSEAEPVAMVDLGTVTSHPPRQARGERLRRILQRQVSRRVFERELVPGSRRCTREDRDLAPRLQPGAAPQLAR